MSAETLRRAAALMRERAEAALAGRWVTADSALQPDSRLVVADGESGPRRVATCAGSLTEGNDANASHIASWHPAVALAVSDWLDATADRLDLKHNHGWRGSRQALAVARAYLGEVTDA